MRAFGEHYVWVPQSDTICVRLHTIHCCILPQLIQVHFPHRCITGTLPPLETFPISLPELRRTGEG